MRSRKGFFKKLILSGATAVSVIGFASPAVFAWDGGSYSDYGNNYHNNYSNSYRCDYDWDWDDSNCMRLDNYSYSDYHSYHNYNNNCDHRYSNMYW